MLLLLSPRRFVSVLKVIFEVTVKVMVKTLVVLNNVYLHLYDIAGDASTIPFLYS